MRPSLCCLNLLGNRDLLFAGGQIGSRRVLGTAESGPRLLGELQATVEAVSGVDGPVSGGLTLRNGIPGGRPTGRGDGRLGHGAHTKGRGLRFGQNVRRRLGTADLDTVDGVDVEGDGTLTGSTRVVERGLAFGHVRIVDPVLRRLDRQGLGAAVDAIAGHHDLHTFFERGIVGETHAVGLLEGDVVHFQEFTHGRGRETHRCGRRTVVGELHGLGADDLELGAVERQAVRTRCRDIHVIVQIELRQASSTVSAVVHTVRS